MRMRLIVAVTAALLTAGSSLAADKVLRVGTEPTFPPFEFMDKGEQAVGFDIELVRAIGEVQGVQVEIMKLPFDGLIPSLFTGQIDAAASGMTITAQRAEKVDFSAPYYDSGLTAMILKDKIDKFHKIADLSKSVLCAQIGTTGSKHAQEISGNVINFNTATEAVMELKAGRCDAIISDKPVNEYFMATAGNGMFVEINEVMSAEQYGIAVRKGNAETLKIINEGLAKLRENGTYDKLYVKWFGVKLDKSGGR